MSTSVSLMRHCQRILDNQYCRMKANATVQRIQNCPLANATVSGLAFF